MGSPLAGKSTLGTYLRETQPDIPIVDFDRAILDRNNNTWPPHGSELMTNVQQKVLDHVLQQADILFLSWELPNTILKKFKAAGFIVGQLVVPEAELKRRNEVRLQLDPHKDAHQFALQNLIQQEKSFNAGVVDFRIDGTLETKEVARLVKQYATN